MIDTMAEMQDPPVPPPVAVDLREPGDDEIGEVIAQIMKPITGLLEGIG